MDCPRRAGVCELPDEPRREYDNAPEIQDVSITGCMTIYAEPLIRETSSALTVSDLLAVGYTLAADEHCQDQEIIAHEAWNHTHSSLAFNPYQVINANGTTGVDRVFTQSLMGYCRQMLGYRCTLGNDSIRNSDQHPGPELSGDVCVDTGCRSDQLLSDLHPCESSATSSSPSAGRSARARAMSNCQVAMERRSRQAPSGGTTSR